LCEPSSVATSPGLDDADAHVPLGDFLAQGLGESVLGEPADGSGADTAARARDERGGAGQW
jgi:hypothetical protein